jgi:hypothetical protein
MGDAQSGEAGREAGSAWLTPPEPAGDTPVPDAPWLSAPAVPGPAEALRREQAEERHRLSLLTDFALPGEGEPLPAMLRATGDRWQLRVLAGHHAGSVYPLSDGLTLGRETANLLSIPDARVSRYHARIDRVEEAWIISDLGSTNGTRLNGVPIVRAGLEAGDYLYVGDTVLRLERNLG